VTELATAPELNDRGLEGFGKTLLFALSGCDPAILASRNDLIRFVSLLAKRIGMTTYGDALAELFGEGDLVGETVVQLITTSHMAMHARPSDNTLFFDLTSCKDFDAEDAVAFAKKFFRASNSSLTVVPRTAPPA
jgi:S-adenosylmethionine decarboxylase